MNYMSFMQMSFRPASPTPNPRAAARSPHAPSNGPGHCSPAPTRSTTLPPSARLLAALVFISAVSLLPSHAAQLPAAKEIVARYVKAIGGRDAVLKYSAVRMKGNVEMAAQGIKGDFEMWTAKPDLMGVKINLPGIGEIRTGYNGKIGWSQDPVQGPMLLSGKMLDQLRDQAQFDAILHDEKDYKSMEVLEKTTFENKPVYKVKFVRRSGQETTEYFDVDSGLQLGADSVQESAMGALPTTTVLSGYRKFGNLLMPSKMTQKIGPLEQVITISSVEYDKVPATDFALPEAIKALAEKAPAAP